MSEVRVVEHETSGALWFWVGDRHVATEVLDGEHQTELFVEIDETPENVDDIVAVLREYKRRRAQ